MWLLLENCNCVGGSHEMLWDCAGLAAFSRLGTLSPEGCVSKVLSTYDCRPEESPLPGLCLHANLTAGNTLLVHL